MYLSVVLKLRHSTRWDVAARPILDLTAQEQEYCGHAPIWTPTCLCRDLRDDLRRRGASGRGRPSRRGGAGLRDGQFQ